MKKILLFSIILFIINTGYAQSNCRGVTEICNNGIDDDCDGLVDEGNGNALSFDGNDDRVEVPDNPLLDMDPGESFTIET